MSEYQAVLFSPDGQDWVVDHRAETVSDVWNLIDDQGSRWFFYPIPFVTRAHSLTRGSLRIVAAPEGFEDLEGRTLNTAGRWIAENHDLVEMVLS